MNLLGKHQVSFDLLRALAVQCHALDISAYHLFVDGTHSDGLEKTQSAWEELFTSELLGLAIALRTKFYQGLDHRSTIPFVSHCGLLYKTKKSREETVAFSMKDICDKVIHAETISRCMEKGVPKPTTTLCGADGRDGSTWELSMSVSLFSEAVLNWIRSAEIEPSNTPNRTK